MSRARAMGRRGLERELLKTKRRRAMWKHAQLVLRKLAKVLPVSSVYLLGSFTTAKARPQDIDVIVLVKTQQGKREQWSVDFQVVPDNRYGSWMLEECRRWMKRKYGAKKSAVIRLT